MQRKLIFSITFLLASVYCAGLAHAYTWTDDPLSPGQVVKAAHINELQEAARDYLAKCGKPVPGPLNPVSEGDRTVNNKVNELLRAIKILYGSEPVGNSVDDGNIANNTVIGAEIIRDMREALDNNSIIDCTAQCPGRGCEMALGESCTTCPQDCDCVVENAPGWTCNNALPMGICIPPVCKNLGDACAVSTDCCGGNTCYNLRCVPTCSKLDNEVCTADAECCSGSCVSGVCASCNNNGICEIALGETNTSCRSDCWCGDPVQAPDEECEPPTPGTCDVFCKNILSANFCDGTDICNASEGENCTTCPSECGACVNFCDGTDLCNSSKGEDCNSCPTECGACPPNFCDGTDICNALMGENCSNCSAECSCSAGFVCSGGACVPQSCQPTICKENISCGPANCGDVPGTDDCGDPCTAICPACVCAPTSCTPASSCGGSNCGDVSGVNDCGDPCTFSCPPCGCGACTPTSGCSASNCGNVAGIDGCGNSCTAVCPACVCTPTSCTENLSCSSANCGDVPGTDDCGDPCTASCPACCNPSTCADQGKNCGSIGDGCGNTINCGNTCPGTQTCGGGGIPNVCGGGCNAISCAAQGKNCDFIDDTCGNTIYCGGCPPSSGQSCGGGGIPNVCGGVISCNGNGSQDNGETGIDCGGGGCPACGACGRATCFECNSSDVCVENSGGSFTTSACGAGCGGGGGGCNNNGVCDAGEDGSNCPGDCCDADTPCFNYKNGSGNTLMCRNMNGTGYQWMTLATATTYCNDASDYCNGTSLCGGLPIHYCKALGTWQPEPRSCGDGFTTCPTEECDLGTGNNGSCPSACSIGCTVNGACGTCSDGVKNQNEVGVDCGGVCPACPTCSDGIKNQNETGVDCGGECGPCPCPAACTYSETNQATINTACGCGPGTTGPASLSCTAAQGSNGCVWGPYGPGCTPPSCSGCSCTPVCNQATSANVSPSSSTITLGQSVNFTASASGGTAPYRYRYYWKPVGGGTWTDGPQTSNFTFTPPSVGTFDVHMWARSDCSTPPPGLPGDIQATATVTVTSCACAGGSLCDGTNLTSTACGTTVCGGGNVQYTCQNNGTWSGPGAPCGTCPNGTLCDGTPVTGTCGQVVCGGGPINYKCQPNGTWLNMGSACTCSCNNNGVMDNGETGIDCGGGGCGGCAGEPDYCKDTKGCCFNCDGINPPPGIWYADLASCRDPAIGNGTGNQAWGGCGCGIGFNAYGCCGSDTKDCNGVCGGTATNVGCGCGVAKDGNGCCPGSPLGCNGVCGGPTTGCCTADGDCPTPNNPDDCTSPEKYYRCVSGMCNQSTLCPPACFLAGTKVQTPGGSVPIEKLNKGDRVWSVDPKTMTRVSAMISEMHERTSPDSLRVKFSNGGSVQVTSEHPFFSPPLGDYKPIGDFKVGDEVMWFGEGDSQTLHLTIQSIEHVAGSVTVYNMTVDGEFSNYTAEGVLVHNKGGVETQNP